MSPSSLSLAAAVILLFLAGCGKSGGAASKECQRHQAMVWDAAGSYYLEQSMKPEDLIAPQKLWGFFNSDGAPRCPLGTNDYAPFRLFDGPRCPHQPAEHALPHALPMKIEKIMSVNYAPKPPFVERARLTEFTASGVRVAFFMETDAGGQPLLRATFTPTDAGFHLYSKDLDPKTTGGVGRATQLELLPHPSVQAIGKLFADLTPKSERVETLGTTVEIYPDGPVTFRLPIQLTGGTNIPVQVAVSYMACKTDGVCLRPVDRRIVDIQLPAGHE